VKWSLVSPLRIAVLDDHSLVQLALKVRLSREPDFFVVGVYASSQELLSDLPTLGVDLLILDYVLGNDELDGLNLLRLIRRRFPELLILISSSAEKPAIVNLIMNAGANGFYGKSEEVDKCVEAVRKVACGGVYVSPLLNYELGWVPGAIHERVKDDSTSGADVLLGDPGLSPKEQEVLRCCLDGMSVSQIALKFKRSMKTISGQKQAAFRKLGIRNDSELFMMVQSIKR
jgi:two-component system capsular synthesis response regulator RcsB